MAVSLCTISCVKEAFNNDVAGQDSGQLVSFVAYRNAGETKTVLAEGGSVLWSPGDSINVFYGRSYQDGNRNKCVSENTTPASMAVFTGNIASGSLSAEEDGMYYAVYPYSPRTYHESDFLYYTFPDVQYARKGSFGEGAFPAAAKSKDTELTFYNLCGGIKLSVTKPGVTRIAVRSNAGEPLSGQGTIWFDDNGSGKPIVNIWEGEGKDCIDLIAPEGGFEVGVSYYLIVPPVVLSQGFTISFMTATEVAVRNVDKTVEIKRSIFSKMTEADRSLAYTRLPSAEEMLSGADGVKYWMWDIFSEYDGSPWGAGANWGNGYPADRGQIPDRWWGSVPENIAPTESSFAYMRIDKDANCVSYSEDGKEVRRGKINISDFNASYRRDGWSIGKFSTDAPAILWPYADGQDAVTEFDILRLTEDEMILGYNDPRYAVTGNGNQYYWWRFRSVDKSTFEKGRPTGISLDKTSIEVYQGDEFSVTAMIAPEDRSFWGVTWSYDNYDVLYSYGSGRFGTGSPGKATVTARTAGGLTASCEVTVKERIPVTSFEVDPSHVELDKGETAVFTAKVMPENATLKEVTWTSENPDVANVDQDGKVTAVSPGWTYLIATTDGGRWSRWCSVYVRDNSVYGISLSEYGIELFPGESATVTASVYPDNAENKAIIWESFNTDIATVDNDGNVTAVAPGWTQIRAVTEENGYEAYCGVYVREKPVSGVVLDKTSAELFVGDYLVLVATVLPENASNQKVTWHSDKSEVATVDRNGLVKAVGSGNATITVKTQDGSFTATCTLTVRSNGVEPGIGEWEIGDSHSGETY